MKYKRAKNQYRDAKVRQKDWNEIYNHTGIMQGLQMQAARCMDCGVPFCQSDNGCPLGNIIPKWNDLVFRVSNDELNRRKGVFGLYAYSAGLIRLLRCAVWSGLHCLLIVSLHTVEYINIYSKGPSEIVPRYNDTFVPQDLDIKKNLLLYRIPTCTSIMNDKKPFTPYLLQEIYVVEIC